MTWTTFAAMTFYAFLRLQKLERSYRLTWYLSLLIDCLFWEMLLPLEPFLPPLLKQSKPAFDIMAPPLARSAPGELNHWWGQLRFRLQNRKGWNQMLDETFLLQNKRWERETYTYMSVIIVIHKYTKIQQTTVSLLYMTSPFLFNNMWKIHFVQQAL